MNNTNPQTPTEKLFAIYGRTPPVQCLGRLETEKRLIHRSFFDDAFLVCRLREAARKDSSDVDVTGNYGASLINWLEGATGINPLPPHYHCQKCRRTLFFTGGDGFDLPVLECCGIPMLRDGHGIPLEGIGHILQNSKYELCFSIAGSFSEEAVSIVRQHYKRDFELIPYSTGEDEIHDLQFVLIPLDESLPELDENGIWQTDLEKLLDSKHRVICFRFSDVKEKTRGLRIKLGKEPLLDELLSRKVMAAVEQKLRDKIAEAGATPLEADELSFSSLLRMMGYLCSSHTEDNPALFQPGAKYSDVFTWREEVWDHMMEVLKQEYGISTEYACEIMRLTRSGRFTQNRMSPETEQLLRGLGLSEHWIMQMKNTGYLPAKADLINYLLDELQLTWFELQEESQS